jgi:PAS domain-containing protein
MDHRADVRGLLSNGQDLGTGNGEPMPSASPDLLMRTMEGRLTFWPAGMEQRYGFTSEQALGHVSHQLLKTIYPRALNEIEETLLRQSNWSGGLIHRHADGRAVMVVGHWYLHRNDSGYDAVNIGGPFRCGRLTTWRPDCRAGTRVEPAADCHQ